MVVEDKVTDAGVLLPVIWAAGFDSLGVVCIDLLLALEDAHSLVAVEFRHGAAVFGAVDAVGRYQRCGAVGAELLDFVLVERRVEAYAVMEVVDALLPADGEFVADVRHLTDVDGHGVGGAFVVVVDTRSVGHDFPVEHVLGLAVVVVVGYVEFVVEEAQVDAEVTLVNLLPFDVLVGNLVVGPARNFLVAAEVVENLVAYKCAGVKELCDAVVTEDTVRAADFGVGYPVEVLFDEFLLAETPHHVHRGECAPAVVLAEAVGAVAADVGREVVAVVIAEVDTAEERQRAALVG